MPPRIRTTRASKALKENIDVTANNLKPVKNTTKAPRKALADKTNSASDDASTEIPTKSKKTVTKTTKTGSDKNRENKQNVETTEIPTKSKKTVTKTTKTGSDKNRENKQNVETKQKHIAKSKENLEPTNDVRRRRDRRLPKRFAENTILNNLSNSKDNPIVTLNSSTINPKADNTPVIKESLSKSDKPEPSPFKTPAKVDSSLLASRPRRICRLPSRFEDHSISPNKYIPIQPANASTPIQQSKTKPVVPLNDKENVNKNVGKDLGKNQATKSRPTRLAKINALQKESSDNSSDKSSPDSNNNAKGRSSRKKGIKTQPPANKKQSLIKKNQSPIRKFLTPMNKFQSSINKIQSPLNKSPIKKISPNQSTNNKKVDKNLSFNLLESQKMSQESDNKDYDVYEFTFDSDEEPIPQKKKRKRTFTKKPTPTAKPKKVYKSIYDLNISKAIAALRNAVKSGKDKGATKPTQVTENSDVRENVKQNNVANNVNEVQTNNVTKENNMALNDTGKNSVHECNYPSIRVEDIAADIEPSIDHHDDINYSPVNSPKPNGLKTPNASVNHRASPERSIHNNDPLNLLEELSFFDEQPVASSSMNMSVRDPLASPWRVEFGALPVKWPVNTYVKPNLTPAVECSFINPEDSVKKKHVYTNILPQSNDMLPDIGDNTSNLKQTSIISFIKEMAEKSAKKRRKSVPPIDSIYQEVVDINNGQNKNNKSVKEATVNKAASRTNNTSEDASSSANDTSNDKENSTKERKTRKHKNDENLCDVPAKSPRKQKDKDCTFFGFDESGNDENISPIKINNPSGRFLRPRSKAVLQEFNGPTRAALPIAAKTKIATSSEAVNRMYEELKSAADAPVFPEKNVDDNVTNIADPSINDESQSVHLFEDIELLQHFKPICKSYSKPKKVIVRQHSVNSSDSYSDEDVVADQNNLSDDDDLPDLSFEIPDVTEKKVTKKKKRKKLRSKKEEKEAAAWAANFNSMCEDIEGFPLVVE